MCDNMCSDNTCGLPGHGEHDYIDMDRDPITIEDYTFENHTAGLVFKLFDDNDDHRVEFAEIMNAIREDHRCVSFFFLNGM